MLYSCLDFFVTAIHDYSSENREDLSFKSGDEIKIVERINADWLMGECNGKRGLFPASFVQDGQLGSSPVGKAANGKNGQTKVCQVSIVCRRMLITSLYYRVF